MADKKIANKKKWEIDDVVFMRWMVLEEGKVSGKIILSPSSKAQSLPTEKNFPDCFSPIVV